MIYKEYFATNYTFYRFPNLHLIILVPLLPSLFIAIISSNLHLISEGVFADVETISANIILTFMSNYKMILSIVTSFFFVYRWSAIQTDGSYGYWLTQGIDRNRFMLVAIGVYSMIISAGELTGSVTLIIYLGLQFTWVEIVALVLGILLSNVLFTLIAIGIANFITRADVAGLIFAIITVLNYTVNQNQDSIIFNLFRLESSFRSPIFFLAALVVILFIFILGGLNMYFNDLKDVDI